MEKLNLPSFDFRTMESEGRSYIFDRIRKKFVACTPEEWVRQHMVALLVETRNVPLPLLAVEKKLLINNLEKRFDICVFSRRGNPVLLVECKAPSVKITQRVFDQAARYNLSMNAGYFIITNGLDTHCCQVDYRNRSYRFLEDIPDFSQLDQPSQS